MSRIMQRLRQDHVNLIRLLDILDHQLGRVSEATRADYELMKEVMQYMTRYPDAVHHPTEDVVFQRLMQRDGSARAAVEGLLREHRQITEKSERFRDQLLKVVDGALVSRDDIGRDGREFVSVLRRHVEREEAELFPLAERVLGEDDWRELDELVGSPDDPLFGPLVADEFQVLLQHVVQQTR